jgi:phospholipid transport system substrate-binding protein
MIPTARAVIPALVLGADARRVCASGAEVTDPAGKQVEAFYATLVDSMRNAKELGVEGRFKKLEPVVEATFDLPEMARLTVGPSWMSMAEPERQDVVAAFRRMTIANYASSSTAMTDRSSRSIPTSWSATATRSSAAP